MPETSCMKNGSMPRVWAGRSITRPNASALPAVRARAALLGWKPTSWAIARMRSLVAAETPGWPFRAKETAALVTPARWAMSAMVGRFIRLPFAARRSRLSITAGVGRVRDASRTDPGKSRTRPSSHVSIDDHLLNRYSPGEPASPAKGSSEQGEASVRRDTARVMTGSGPAFWLGANFWSRTGGPLMWRSYRSDVIRADLAVLKDHGLTMTRSFFYWPDFMPGPYEIDETLTARFADFLDRHAEQGLTTIPTFIVGHMSGENWDPGWRNGRHLYEDVWMVGRQAWFAAEMTRRFADHPAVAGWLVSNEMPIYGGSTTDPETVAAGGGLCSNEKPCAGGSPTAREPAAAGGGTTGAGARAAAGPQPFSLGDGA